MGYNKVGYNQAELRREGKRRCSRCKTVKPITEFRRCKAKRQGREYRCKICADVATTEARQKQDPLGRWSHSVIAKRKSLQKQKGIPYDIDADYLISIFPKDNKCPVLGIEFQFSRGRQGPQDSSPTVDRLSPKGGYTKDNIAIISQRANRLKNDATLAEVKLIFDWYSAQHSLAT